MSVYLPVLALLIVAVVVAFARWKKREQEELFRLLQRQAEKRGGRTKPGTILYYPKLTLSREGVELTASALLAGGRPDRRSAMTYVTFPLVVPPDHGFRITKKTKSVQSFVEGRLGGSRIRTGNPAFDQAFRVQGENEVTALHFLTETVQRSLLAFDETVDVHFDNDQFTVKVDEIVKREATLDRMLDLALLAHGSLCGPRPPRRSPA